MFISFNICSENTRTTSETLLHQSLFLYLPEVFSFPTPGSPGERKRGNDLIRQRSVGRFILFQNTGFQQLVDQLFHGVVGAQETLRRHDDADAALGHGSFTFSTGLKGDEVEADHGSCEVNLTDSVCKNFFLTTTASAF